MAAERPKHRKRSKRKPDERVVRLEDLAPRDDPRAGGGKVLFGQGPGKPDAPAPARPKP
jgi:hypothetical protein